MRQNVQQADLFDEPRYTNGKPVYQISSMCRSVFKHEHVRQDRVIADVRSLDDQDVPPKLDEFNFIGFRVDRPEGALFYHIMLIAPDRHALTQGIEQEIEHLKLMHSALPADAVKLVFFRNLRFQHPDLFPRRYRMHLMYFLDDFMEFQCDMRFAIFAISNQKAIRIEEEFVPGKDGLHILKQALLNPDFSSVLDLQQAHPANYEFNALYYRAVKLLSSIMTRDMNLEFNDQIKLGMEE